MNSARPGRKPVRRTFKIGPPHALGLTAMHRGDKASKRSEGMPAFGLPVLSLLFLIESFLFRIYWIKPSIFGREVRMKCLYRFVLRLRGALDPRSLHALRPVSPHFRMLSALSSLGSGSDGAKGPQATKEAGGITFAEEENYASFHGMPSSAIQTGCMDFILNPLRHCARANGKRLQVAYAPVKGSG
jgi:hypothetical protein